MVGNETKQGGICSRDVSVAVVQISVRMSYWRHG